MATSEAGLVEQLVKGLTEALKQNKPSPVQRPIKLSWFSGRPGRPGDPTVKEWHEEVEILQAVSDSGIRKGSSCDQPLKGHSAGRN